ncbi:Hypothetical protein OINT_1000218 [Brucella intermedia LMG 3301]|uniref:Uncharacterized protein n=1 Tax=Brucella intermedia LMG 3301 TaxID=641118 RepID=C4WH20_9HYPH|nr:Hypothetical protein OINT_1000218 [Brucella intermedia LMG 3301]
MVARFPAAAISDRLPPSPIYPSVFTHYPTQNRFALLLEML